MTQQIRINDRRLVSEDGTQLDISKLELKLVEPQLTLNSDKSHLVRRARDLCEKLGMDYFLIMMSGSVEIDVGVNSWKYKIYMAQILYYNSK